MSEAPRLADYEGDEELSKEAYAVALKELQAELGRIQAVYIGQHRRVVIAIEGWDAAGKGGFIRRLTANWDPRFFDVIPVRAPTAEEKAHHYLWRFWQNLPAHGEVNIFDRTWYGRVLVERVEGFANEAEWQRAYDEINAFEAMLADDGAILIKLFFHVSQEVQDKRLIARIKTPYKRWKVSAEDFRNRNKRAAYTQAIDEMFVRTHTTIAPWRVINGNDKKTARIAALRHVVGQLSKGCDLHEPELGPEIAALARATFGDKLNGD